MSSRCTHHFDAPRTGHTYFTWGRSERSNGLAELDRQAAQRRARVELLLIAADGHLASTDAIVVGDGGPRQYDGEGEYEHEECERRPHPDQATACGRAGGRQVDTLVSWLLDVARATGLFSDASVAVGLLASALDLIPW